MARIHVTEEEASRDFAALMNHVRAGAEVVIENGILPVAVLHLPTPVRRSLAECIALAQKHEEESGTAPVLDPDFAADVEQVISGRKPWNPPSWD